MLPSQLTYKNIALLIASLSLVLSMGYSFFYRIPPVVDAQAYDRIAVNLISGYGFREDATRSFESDTAIVRAGPAYEFFLAGAYKAFGHHYEVIWILQAILHALTVYILFLICRETFPRGNGDAVGIIASTIYGLHPDLIEISAMLMTETLYLFLTVLSIFLFVRLYRNPGKINYTFFLALSFAAAILSRPPVLLFLPIILMFYVSNRYYRQGLLLLILLTASLSPWVIRNYFVYHQFIPTTLVGEYNLWLGNTLTSSGGQFSAPVNPLTDFIGKSGASQLKAKADMEFKNFIIGHPLVFIKLSFLRFIRYFSLIRPMGFWFYQSGLGQAIFVLFSLIGGSVLFTAGFSGMVLALKNRQGLINYLLCFAVSAPLALLPAVVESRYRFQIYPFLAIFSGYLLAAAWEKKSDVKRAFFTALIPLAVITAVDFLTFLPLIKDRLMIFIK